jgi:predicted nucleic acid-binding protein
MVLVDTSVWVEHFRGMDTGLALLLENTQVLGHPFVNGELACGNLAKRAEILGLLEALPQAEIVQQAEALDFLQSNHFYGRGLGWIDIHLLASAVISGARFWTEDRRLKKAAEKLNISY